MFYAEISRKYIAANRREFVGKYLHKCVVENAVISGAFDKARILRPRMFMHDLMAAINIY